MSSTILKVKIKPTRAKNVRLTGLCILAQELERVDFLYQASLFEFK